MSELRAKFETTEERNEFIRRRFIERGIDVEAVTGEYALPNGGYLIVDALSVEWCDNPAHNPFVDGPSFRA